MDGTYKVRNGIRLACVANEKSSIFTDQRSLARHLTFSTQEGALTSSAVATSGATATCSGASARPGDLSGPPATSGRAAVAHSLPVQLDGFHGMTRITKLVPKGHGARLIFVALLRDCFFMVNKGDIEAVERALENKGKSIAEVSQRKDKTWSFFLQNVRAVCRAPTSSCHGLMR